MADWDTSWSPYILYSQKYYTQVFLIPFNLSLRLDSLEEKPDKDSSPCEF